VQIRAIKGVRDILPPQSTAWNRVDEIARQVFATYGFGEIRTPVLEDTKLFDRSVGAETDIVSKEMYRIESSLELGRRMLLGETEYPEIERDQSAYFRFVITFRMFIRVARDNMKSGELATHGQNAPIFNRLAELYDLAEKCSPHEEPAKESDRRAIRVEVGELCERITMEKPTLRPEATASVVRAYIEHGMHTLPGDVKLYYMGPMFRRERPQKGRYRQFYQIGAEVLGQSDAPGIDAELIEMLFAFFGRVGLEGLSLDLNSIGCKDCRGKYVEVLRAELVKVKDKLGVDSQRRIETNPLRVLDSKAQDEQAIIETLPRISDHLCDACKTHFAEVLRQLDLRDITYNLNWRLVRGLDYYMRTTFEIIAPGLGSQNAVCGGGRYDGLVELLGGHPTKGIGFAIGEDRLMLSLEAAGKLAVEPAVDAFIVWMGAATQPTAIKIAQRLRGAGIKVELPPEEFKFKKALGLADKLGARYAILIGENEIAAGKFTLKRLADAVQTSVTEVELVEALKTN
jgi:histidyl-tRNA synthetase